MVDGPEDKQAVSIFLAAALHLCRKCGFAVAFLTQRCEVVYTGTVIICETGE
jgi:hypothetical protein